MTLSDFLRRIDNEKLTALDRALALLWFVGREDPIVGMTAAEICLQVERAGHPKQNVNRLRNLLKDHRGTSKAAKGAWRLHPRMRRELDASYAFALKPKPVAASDSVLPSDLFSGTRGYVERVVEQINKSYDVQLWDCTAVMCRRLLETLIVETYEKAGRASEIKGADGHFMMLNGLITFLEHDSLNLGRNALKGLKDFKLLGDLSAHNRRFNARQDDIDRVRDGLRVATEELLHLSGLREPPKGPH
ncbi:MAG: hypothetical protein WBQ76_12370 [Candidatus Korobacteraceae bacterium]